jgi:D-amino-acid dehydrogenase
MSRQIVILGGGVIGLSAAYYCARRGFKVTVVERHGPERDGTSYGNAGMIVPSHFVPLAAPGMVALGLKWMSNPASPFYIQPRWDAELIGWGIKFWRAATAKQVARAAPLLRDLALASRACFEELAGEWEQDFGLVKKGLLMLCQSAQVWHEESSMVEKARALGIPAYGLDARQTADLDPAIRLDIAGSVYFPKDCHLSPGQFMAALQAQLEKLGVQFLWQTAAAGFRVENKRIRAVKFGLGGELEGDEFLVCGGSWSPEMTRELGLKIPLQAGKGYSLTLPHPRQLPQICTILTEARVAVTPMGNTLRVGGTMEIAGLNDEINPVRVQGIIDSFCRYYPEFKPGDFAGIQPWRGWRPCSPDGLPYVGRTRKFQNLSLATGHAMMGMSLAPITGKLMAGLLAGENPALDLSLLSPDRYP